MQSKGRPARGQAAVEVLSYAAFFFLVFVSAVAVFLSVQGQELARAQNAYAQEIAYGLADSVHTAFVAGPGFSQTLSLPRDILGRPYSVSISRSLDASSAATGFVYVEWQSGGKSAVFSAATVTSDYQPVLDGHGFVRLEQDGKMEFIVIDATQNRPLNISNRAGAIFLGEG